MLKLVICAAAVAGAIAASTDAAERAGVAVADLAAVTVEIDGSSAPSAKVGPRFFLKTDAPVAAVGVVVGFSEVAVSDSSAMIIPGRLPDVNCLPGPPGQLRPTLNFSLPKGSFGVITCLRPQEWGYEFQ